MVYNHVSLFVLTLENPAAKTIIHPQPPSGGINSPSFFNFVFICLACAMFELILIDNKKTLTTVFVYVADRTDNF